MAGPADKLLLLEFGEKEGQFGGLIADIALELAPQVLADVFEHYDTVFKVIV
jgi:hypothetical protein